MPKESAEELPEELTKALVEPLAPGRPSRHAGYRAMSSRSHRVLRCVLAVALATTLPLAFAGCSFSYQLDSLFAKKEEQASAQIESLRLAVPKPAPDAPAEGDLVIARAAAREVLAKGGKGVSMPWENPQTGARGTITPLASAYSQDGLTCRDFLASYVKNGSEAWLQGAACRAERGKWEVRHMRSWKNT